MKYRYLIALAAALTGTAFAAFQAPLPEFKNEKQLAAWRAEMVAKPAAKATTEDPAFYTGKPYVASTGGYAFKYRSYNPELARWTSEDPSGFPDGANNQLYSNNPLSGADSDGCAWSKYDFMIYFYTGAGKPVNLSDIGLLSAVQNVADADPSGGAFKFGKQIERTADAINKPYQGSFSNSFNQSYDFTSASWCIGGAVLSGTYDGWMTSTPYPSGTVGGTYDYHSAYNNPTTISFSDTFTDPISIIKALYGSSTSPSVPGFLRVLMNLGGTPFQIVGSWDEVYTGFGYYE